MFTCRYKLYSKAKSSAQQERRGESSFTADVIGQKPGQKVSRDFHDGDQYEINVFVTSESYRVQR